MQTSAPDKIATPQSNYEKYKDKFVTGKKDTLSMQSFYKLLVAEMSNQDPMEPTSNTEFISQMASFASLQSQQDNFDMQKQNYANSLVGQTVSVQGGKKDDLITGVVQYVTAGSDIKINVDGKNYSLDSIKQVHGFESLMSGESAEQQAVYGDSSLANYGAFAAGILGKTITVQATKPNGELLLDSGTAQSLEIKDGQVRVILNGLAYNVTDIVSVTDAVKVRGDSSSYDDDEDDIPAAPAQTAKPEEKPAETVEDDKTDEAALVERTDEADIQDIAEEAEAQQTQQTDPTQQAQETAVWIPQQTESQELYDLFG